MLSELPLDILINVLSFLTPIRSRGDTNASTLVACLRVNSLFAEAARVPLLWKVHYETRFEHHDEEAELARLAKHQDDWRLLYFERGRIDHQIRQKLRELIFNRTQRQRLAQDILVHRMDAWDTLELEQRCPVSPPFHPCSHNEDDRGKAPQYAVTYRYWATHLLEVVSRYHAVRFWGRFWKEGVSSPTFEETMTHLSCFFGHSPKRIKGQLDALAEQCKAHLINKQIIVGISSNRSQLLLLCEEIVEFMRSQGFCVQGGREWYALENKLPHFYLSTQRQTIPMSLVHVFIAIATRLGIEARPINFPGTVLINVRHPQSPQNSRPIVVNPAAANDSRVAADLALAEPSQTGVQVLQNPIPANDSEETFAPCSGMSMLFRSVTNIRAAITTLRGEGIPEYLRYPVFLLIVQVTLLFGGGDATIWNLLSSLKIELLDSVCMLEDLLPVLQPWMQSFLQAQCEDVLKQETKSAQLIAPSRKPRQILYFVGMPVAHCKGERGFIQSWTTIPYIEDNTAKLDNLPSDLNKSTIYNIMTFGGRWLSATPSELQPLTNLSDADLNSYLNNDLLSERFFCGVQLGDSLEVEDGMRRGRLIGSPETQHRYPEDNEVGHQWVLTGCLESL